MNPGDLRLFVGLGNPGSKYLGTRHNIGFMALERLAKKESANFKKIEKLNGLIADIGVGEKKIRLLLPTTYMNESGRSIKAALNWFGLEVNQLLVIVDDLDLPLGRLRLRVNGSAGGHNGLKSTINHLGTQEFNRLRIGIGNPICDPLERKERTISHVLGSFSKAEQTLVNKVLDEVLIGFELIQNLGIERAGNRINAFKAQD